VNAFPDSTGDGLTFRVIGEVTSIDPATGEISVPTDALRDGIEIVVTAGNSGGEASSRFRLTVAAEPAASPPVLVTAPSLAGSGLVGEPLSVDPGVWAGEPLPATTLQWRRDGADLPGATAAAYVPGAAEDGKPLTCRVTATNASGSLSAETAALTVTRPAPAVAAVLADVSYVQGSGPQGVDAGAAFSGGGLVFAVEGGGAAIDPATGQVTLPTDALRDGETVRVTASNSGGEAEASFAVTVVAKVPAFPDPIPDSLWRSREVRDEAPAGRRRIDVDPGVIVPAGFTLIWLSGKNSDADLRYYTPVVPGRTETTKGSFPVGTVLYDMVYWRRDEDGAFSPAFVTKTQYTVQGLYPKPVLVEPIPDRAAVQGDPSIVFDASLAFYPDGGRDGAAFSVTGTGASIDAATGIVTITTAAQRSGDPVTVTATTVSGSTDGSFRVTVTAKTASFPPNLADAQWADGEERDVAPAGRMKVLVAAGVDIPAGFELCWSPTENPDGVPEWSVPQTPGTDYTTKSTSEVGTTIHSMLFWRRGEDGAYQLASAKRTHVVQGLRTTTPPPSGMPVISDRATNIALDLGLFRTVQTGSYGGARSPANAGPQTVALALRQMAAPRADVRTRLLQQIRHSLEGKNCLLALTGYTAQYDLNHVGMFALARNIPDIWADLTGNEKSRVDALMKAALVGGAWASADNNPNTKAGKNNPDFCDYSNYRRTWAPNFRLAMVGTVLACIPYFGGVKQVLDILDGYSHASLRSALGNLGLSNAKTSWDGAFTISGAPSATTIQNAVGGFRYYGLPLSDIQGIVETEADKMWNKSISSGLNDGAGIYDSAKKDQRGLMISGAGSLPNKGVKAMAQELDGQDAEGKRSAMSYAVGGARCELIYMCVLAATGYLSRDTKNMSSLLDRMDKGYTDLIAKTDGGYKSYAKGGGGSTNNETWTRSWATSNYSIDLTFDMYTSFLRPALA
jgi:hypothetical protein